MTNTVSTTAKQAQLSDNQFLADTANAIRALGRNVIRDIVEIGRLLVEAKERAGHGNWRAWLDQEFGWSQDTAERFMSLHRLRGQIPQIADYDVPVSGLYLLARQSTPERGPHRGARPCRQWRAAVVFAGPRDRHGTRHPKAAHQQDCRIGRSLEMGNPRRRGDRRRAD